MLSNFRKLAWYHATRAVAIVLVMYGLALENDPGTRGTLITAAIGLMAAEPVARRGEKAPSGASNGGSK